MPDPVPNFNHNQPIYSVTEVSSGIKRAVEERFGVVRIRGEISGFKHHSSGHAYFALKDDKAVIDAVCWRGNVSKLAFKPEDGLEIIGTGKITTYAGRSKYQIVIDHMEPAGAGALMALLEKRRKQLEAEGLFSPERKKPIPYLPQKIGVITSPTGAVIRDILHRISDRFACHVIVWPVAVQGDAAQGQITAAIKGFNALPDGHPAKPDVLIVARGGGSIEDLWAFNEESVVRAAAESVIPLISAVGHETDTTLIDFVSDRRAPTPTAAAEMALPVRQELQLTVQEFDTRLKSAMLRRMQQQEDQLTGLVRGLPKPDQLLHTAMQRLDDWSERLVGALPNMIERKSQALAVPSAGLKPQGLLAHMKQAKQRGDDLQARLHHAAKAYITRLEASVKHHSALLESMNYKRVLERGFALVKDDAGVLVTNSKAAAEASGLEVVFHDGSVKVSK